MAHFSVSGDSIASHCIFVGIGFETCTCNNHYLAAFVLPGPAICSLLAEALFLVFVDGRKKTPRKEPLLAGKAICFYGKMLCFLSRFFVS